MRIHSVFLGSIAAALLAAGSLAAPAVPLTAEQFIERCKSDEGFCRIQIMAAEELLERSRKACLPASVTKDAMATRVRDVIEDVIDEAPELRTGSYRQFVEQIITYLWPCEPIS